MTDFYTEEIQKHIYNVKQQLPNDFKIRTRMLTDEYGFVEEEFPCIVIGIAKNEFEWRTVEDRLDIAIKLERLRTLIEETGIRCVIDKPA